MKCNRSRLRFSAYKLMKYLFHTRNANGKRFPRAQKSQTDGKSLTWQGYLAIERGSPKRRRELGPEFGSDCSWCILAFARIVVVLAEMKFNLKLSILPCLGPEKYKCAMSRPCVAPRSYLVSKILLFATCIITHWEIRSKQ